MLPAVDPRLHEHRDGSPGQDAEGGKPAGGRQVNPAEIGTRGQLRQQQADGQGEQLYTRAGSFSPDYQGDLRTTSGQYLQGWALDDKEQIANIRRQLGLAGT